MVSHPYRCIFVAVPKTGSTSIRKIVGWPNHHHQDLMELKADILEYENETLSHFRKLQILHIPYVRKKYINRTFQSYFKFGFVRNPWDRVVSLYNRKENREQRHHMGFDEFVNWIQLSSDTCVHPTPHRYQLDWFKDGSGKVVADFIGKFEHIEKDWAYVAQQLNISEPLPHENSNEENKKHYTEYYTDNTRRIIAEKFKEDIEYFKYNFGK